jgi:CubicO group peptidase (beta-lactamase class C family)
MSSNDYQTEFNQQTAKGFYPICTQGGGTTASPVYAAIFAQQDIPSARQWTATGPAVASLAAFDTAFQQFMQANAVRAAQFAIALNGTLLLARGYTWAEPGYRITQPSDRFLLASCSKMFCEQAIQTLYNAGTLQPPKLVVKPNGTEVPVIGDKVTGNSSGATASVSAISGNTLILNSVLGTFTASDNAAIMGSSGGTVAVVSYTPSTAAYPLLGFSGPADPRSDTITIQQLLDHEGGYNDGPLTTVSSFPDPTYNMRNIAIALGLSGPVDKLQVCQYMYGQALQFTPGTMASYSNYGYLLLSAIVEKVTGMPYFDYVQTNVLAPLGITEVLLSSTEAQLRDPSEAICEDQGLGPDPINITSNLQIPCVYGGDGQIKEVAAGCAGLAASATAMVQFIHVNQVWGNGLREFYNMMWGNNWGMGRDGSTPGTSTAASSSGNGIDWAYVINTRDFPPQTPLPLGGLANTINQIVSSTPGL